MNDLPRCSFCGQPWDDYSHWCVSVNALPSPSRTIPHLYHRSETSEAKP